MTRAENNRYLTLIRKSRENLDRKMNRLSKTTAKIRRPTTRARVLDVLKRKETLMTATATQLAEGLNVRVDSLSSLLKRMVTEGEIETISGIGPRGGAGYQLPPF